MVQPQFIQGGSVIAGFVGAGQVAKREHGGNSPGLRAIELCKIIQRQRGVGICAAQPLATNAARRHPLQREIATCFARETDAQCAGCWSAAHLHIVQVQVGLWVETVDRHRLPHRLWQLGLRQGVAQVGVGLRVEVGVGAIQYQDNQGFTLARGQLCQPLQQSRCLPIGGQHQYLMPERLCETVGGKPCFSVPLQVAL